MPTVAQPALVPHNSLGPKFLILAGAPETGKTGSLTRLTSNFLLKKKGFVLVSTLLSKIPYPPTASRDDFLALFENKQSGTCIVVNTSMDYSWCADMLKEFLKQCRQAGLAPNIIITAGRDADFYPALDFWRTLEIESGDPNVREVPLARITRRTHNFDPALKWYEQRIDALLEHTLSNSRFGL